LICTAADYPKTNKKLATTSLSSIMNKLVIIGNGFDLAHELPTSYKDFILWHINNVFKLPKNNRESDLIKIETNLPYTSVSKIEEYKKILEYNDDRLWFRIKGKNDFIDEILEHIDLFNWVDIESLYYRKVVHFCRKTIDKKYVDLNFSKNSELVLKSIFDLNSCFKLIKDQLIIYLKDLNKTNNKSLGDIRSILVNDLNCFAEPEKIKILNFNYTTTIENYQQHFGENLDINYIHGHINKSTSPIIFGYGDETDEYYEKIENLKDNEFLKHMKSFGYLQTPNYKELFGFLDQEQLAENKREKFDVYIMGHSCGVSDRLLFTHIFEHPLLNSVQLYYYERPDGTNDFYEKTQDLSRHFRKDAKHKMRKCIVPFNESKPLPQYKTK
jgi:hypothetical protein